GIAGGIIVASIFTPSYWIGYYRLPLYIPGYFSMRKTYSGFKSNQAEFSVCLHDSWLYKDEFVYLPLPYLKDILLLALNLEDVDENLKQVKKTTEDTN